jgi:hypothetical protein
MAVAAPARRSDPQTAPAPSRTAPPEPKKRPRDRPRPGGSGRSAAVAPAAPARKPAAPKRRKAAPARKKPTSARASAAPATAPARKSTRKASSAAPARKAPARRKAAPKRRSGGQLIPIAAGTAGRAAVAMTQLPESGLIHRLTRGRAWIGLLGVLLVGIVALNVVTLSFTASAGKVDERITTLSNENSMLQGRNSQHYGPARMRFEAAALGLAPQTEAVPQLINPGKGDVSEAASRLAAAAASSPE